MPADLKAGLDRYFPGWREAAVVAALAAQRSHRHGARQTPQQQGDARLPARSASTSNLYFAGDARDLPYNLSEISLASALEVADLVGRQALAPSRAPAGAPAGG